MEDEKCKANDGMSSAVICGNLLIFVPADLRRFAQTLEHVIWMMEWGLR